MSFDIQRILEDYGIEHWVEGKNVTDGFVNIQCPYCSDKSNHGGFSKNGYVFMCWRCGKHPVIQTLAKVTGLTTKQISELKEKSFLREVMKEKVFERYIVIYHKQNMVVFNGELQKC